MHDHSPRDTNTVTLKKERLDWVSGLCKCDPCTVLALRGLQHAKQCQNKLHNRNVLSEDQISNKDIFRTERLFGSYLQTSYVCVDVKKKQCHWQSISWVSFKVKLSLNTVEIKDIHNKIKLWTLKAPKFKFCLKMVKTSLWILKSKSTVHLQPLLYAYMNI